MRSLKPQFSGRSPGFGTRQARQRRRCAGRTLAHDGDHHLRRRAVVVGGGLVSTITTDAQDLPRIDYAQPPSIALHLVVDDHLVTHWGVI